MNLLAALADPRLLEFMKDQRIQEIISKREVRVTDDYLQTQFISKAVGGEVDELALTFHDGHAVLAGKVTKKVVIPVTVPFSIRFSMKAVTFNKEEKTIRLNVDEIKPLDVDWVTKRIIEKLPFLTFEARQVTCDLTQVPQLAELFGYQVKGINVADLIAFRDMQIRKGELVGKVGLNL